MVGHETYSTFKQLVTCVKNFGNEFMNSRTIWNGGVFSYKIQTEPHLNRFLINIICQICPEEVCHMHSLSSDYCFTQIHAWNVLRSATPCVMILAVHDQSFAKFLDSVSVRICWKFLKTEVLIRRCWWVQQTFHHNGRKSPWQNGVYVMCCRKDKHMFPGLTLSCWTRWSSSQSQIAVRMYNLVLGRFRWVSEYTWSQNEAEYADYR